MNAIKSLSRITVAASMTLAAAAVHADAVTDWNVKANDIIVAGRVGPPPANRALAIANVAVFDAVNAITGRYAASGRVVLDAAPAASVEAAVAAAMRGTLGKLLVPQQAEIDAAYQAALATVPDGAARSAGIAVGEKAAAAILALRGGDGATAPDSYVPFSMPGVYVPTASPAVPHWGKRKPWVLASGDQLRPGAPPALSSEVWARDYNEIKALGGKTSTQRSAAQTEIARFWETTQPVIYYPLARAVALQPGRDVTQNARLLAAVGMAMDDALVAIFDAKYTYNFWRPVTAIRNGDKDGNDATERDPMWAPFIDTPMHPEYPCAHCVISASLGAVLQAEIGNGPMPRLATTSPTAPGVTRSWTSIAEFTQEVANARIYDGVHFRNSTEVGTALGRKVGEMVAAKALR
ncbi:vanadium-dependent haloperoxidase [Polaromonas sp. JS666]|uniref:vanadium-dependent haloperoxidase n=1 Tax=Polaromonas sp. (strain JS666 / ATCC BAA-500) TaxID=296591 RepID=UPI0000533CC3|nr:vanadium-dependent haloperoxidase [Polaromonas sp. JS666]ABE43596.1 phosphoesterase, PA-phosphatase related protein [Polaromonas sp. JS666]